MYIYIYIYTYIKSWPKIPAPLVNMINEVCENLSALLFLLIFYLKNNKNVTFNWKIIFFN